VQRGTEKVTICKQQAVLITASISHSTNQTENWIYRSNLSFTNEKIGTAEKVLKTPPVVCGCLESGPSVLFFYLSITPSPFFTLANIDVFQ